MTDPRSTSCWPRVAMALIAALPVGLSAAPPAPPVQPARLPARAMSMDQAVKMAEQRFKARVVRAEAQQNEGRTVYVLRMLNDSGRVWTVRVDASSGTVL
ncbi:MAG TPA: PepSY domain-containing protein [Steroidobacteraceae bacterium]|nr:PepSY domain-containing protein [Steroidobacteraceae bacterium]